MRLEIRQDQSFSPDGCPTDGCRLTTHILKNSAFLRRHSARHTGKKQDSPGTGKQCRAL
jgi:hypothetical protein